MERCCLSSAISIVIMLECFVIASADPKIISAPSENVVVPLGQTTLKNFNCIANGSSNVLWILNGSVIHHRDQGSYEDLGITFHDDPFAPSGFLISISINVTTARHNNTKLSCFAINSTTQRNSTSSEVTLTIAGPPLVPHPNFRVVNATHIEVWWNKPFALSEFDVRNYVLLISESNSTRNETISVSAADTTYPIRYYLNNRGNIPKECVYMNFLLTAINDAGRSDVGSVIGGFPIAPSPIMDDASSLQHKVTFTSDFIPTLHINFTFPTVCDYHDAKYSIIILNGGGSLVYQSVEETYNNDGPDNIIVVMIDQKLQKDSVYTAEINVSTAVNWTTTQFKFDTNITPKESGIVNNAVAGNQDTTVTVIISSSIAAGLCVILLGLIAIMMTVVILRRRKLRRRNRAHQRELETDEAVQRAAQAMVPNPIYSGNPIYEEICDSTMLKSLRNGVGVSAETTSRDEGYVAVSADAVKNVNWFPVPEESKMVEDKYATFPEDTYTVMNPAGTLSNQSKDPTCEVPFVYSSMHHGNGVLPEQNRLTEANRVITNGEHCAAAAGSAPDTTGFNTQDEERYVKGAF